MTKTNGQTIYKYPVNGADTYKKFTLNLPPEHTFLAFQMQNEEPCLWVMVYPDATKEATEFLIMGTGHVMPDGKFKYLGTTQQGIFVWHLFQVE